MPYWNAARSTARSTVDLEAFSVSAAVPGAWGHNKHSASTAGLLNRQAFPTSNLHVIIMSRYILVKTYFLVCSLYLPDLVSCVGFGAAMRSKTHEQQIDFVDFFLLVDFSAKMCKEYLCTMCILELNKTLSIAYIALAIDPFLGPCYWSLLDVVCDAISDAAADRGGGSHWIDVSILRGRASEGPKKGSIAASPSPSPTYSNRKIAIL